ncbi:MAG: Zn-dependent alcohol dehydrogenase [Gulosibacter sp.]|uniref:Zn-dependent alcohol dehydrogenase n=1 Tax=Gulosibacter sp. TaxID=2817531 RepID=UPI003F91F130
MKAAVLNAVGEKFIIEDVDIDDPIENEVLVDVKACGLCHSDSHIQENDFGFPMPTVLGHEAAGVVTKVGPEVTTVEVGDHVVGSLIDFCGRCPRCTSGRPWQCVNPAAVARTADQPSRLSRNGEAVTQFSSLSGFAEQILTHENNLVKVNKDIPFDKACLLGCGVITGAGTAINTAGVKVGDTVAVIGCGGIGLNAVQGAAIAGARRIIAIDLQNEKLALAKKFGATDTINSGEVEDLVAAVAEITGTNGVDHAIEAIGLKATAEQAVRILREGGGAYLIGMIKPGTRLDVDPFTELLMNQLRIQGVKMGSTNPQQDISLYAELYTQGRLNLDDLVARTISLDEINEGYEELRDGKVARNVIVFD